LRGKHGGHNPRCILAFFQTNGEAIVTQGSHELRQPRDRVDA
jgi:hypothetical protein